MKELLRDLCTLDGVSGLEDEVRDYIQSCAKPYADKIVQDNLGNLLVFKKGKRSIGKTIMISAHMDEVGLIISDITEDGYLKFSFVGAIDRRIVIGKRLKVGPHKIPGIISIKAFHLVEKGEEKKVPKTTDMYIDIGAFSKAEAEKLVEIGDIAAFDSDFIEFGEDFIKCKALDDRIGCAVMLKLIEEDLPVDTWFSFVVQEEVGLRGSHAACYYINPDMAIILEGTTAGDLPNITDNRGACSPGNGAVLPFMDNSAIYDREMLSDIRRLADNNNIKWQHKTLVAGGTDAGTIQRSGTGSRVVAVSAALRYIHTPASTGCYKDFDAILNLTRLYLAHLGGN